MIATRGPARRRAVVVALVAGMLAAALAVQTPLASAGGLPKLPPGVNVSEYKDDYKAIKDDFIQCVAAARGGKQIKECLREAAAAIKALIEQIMQDIKDAANDGDHDHDDDHAGPPDVPEVPTDPVDDVPQLPPTDPPPVEDVDGPRYDLEILVVAADGNEPQLGSIKQTLDYLGVPYDVFVSATEELTADRLFTGDHAKYQAVILTNGEAGYTAGGTYQSGLSAEEWTLLNSFLASFGLRQITWYTWPNPTYGLNYPESGGDTAAAPVTGSLTTEGKKVFDYLTTAPITIRNAWTYLATPADPATIPLIATSQGHALASIYKFPDGRENLALTFDTNEYLVHSHQIGYGLIDWVTKGRFLGMRRVYLDAQVDDVLFPNDLWNVNDPFNMVETYRLSGDDLQKAYNWQKLQNGQSVTKDLKLTMAFNGEGASGDDEYQPDTLTPKVLAIQDKFKWINHTWTHLNLNAATYQETYDEVKFNLEVAKRLKLSDFSPVNLVTPEISGLFNPEAMRAIKDLGIRYVVGDTSRPELGTPSANAAVYNAAEPSIMMIPRRPNNLFYNVSTPQQWVSEYNHLYRSFWGRDLTYGEILDKESDVLLQYVMKGEVYPWMFHQSNLRFYDGSRSLLTDLLGATLAKYKSMFRLPIQSLRQDQIAWKIEERMAFDAADIVATYIKNSNKLKLSSNRTVVVPVTGINFGSAKATYGGDTTSFVTVPGGQTVTISLN